MAYGITKKTPTKEIIVQGLRVLCPTPFAEGQELTASTAGVLNQVFIENIRNNTAKQVRDKAGTEEALDEATFQTILSEYANTYEFGVRSVSGSRVVRDPVEQRARTMAAKIINDSLRKKGMTKKAFLDQFGSSRYEELVDQLLAKNPAITDEAKRQVEAARDAVASEMDIDLGI